MAGCLERATGGLGVGELHRDVDCGVQVAFVVARIGLFRKYPLFAGGNEIIPVRPSLHEAFAGRNGASHCTGRQRTYRTLSPVIHAGNCAASC
jgi:hypothetical protein